MFQEHLVKIQRKVLAPTSRQPLNGQGVLRKSGIKIHEKLKNELEIDLEAGMLEVYLAKERRCARN